jgi:hypothetical protein
VPVAQSAGKSGVGTQEAERHGVWTRTLAEAGVRRGRSAVSAAPSSAPDWALATKVIGFCGAQPHAPPPDTSPREQQLRAVP